MVLTKKDIIEMFCSEQGVSKKASAALVESFFEIIKDELAKGEDVMISGFGKWSVRSKKARKGRNPQTGEVMTIDSRKVITFKPSAVLRRVLEK